MCCTDIQIWYKQAYWSQTKRFFFLNMASRTIDKERGQNVWAIVFFLYRIRVVIFLFLEKKKHYISNFYNCTCLTFPLFSIITIQSECAGIEGAVSKAQTIRQKQMLIHTHTLTRAHTHTHTHTHRRTIYTHIYTNTHTSFKVWQTIFFVERLAQSTEHNFVLAMACITTNRVCLWMLLVFQSKVLPPQKSQTQFTWFWKKTILTNTVFST